MILCLFQAAASAQIFAVPSDGMARIGPNGPLFLTIQPAAVSMQLMFGTPGDSLRASDQSSLLSWYDRRGGPQLDKVTVSTTCLNQRFVLRVTATNPVNGTAMATRTLQDGAPDLDLILHIPHRVHGGAALKYDASASTVDAFGSDVHTVTYTLTRQ